MPRTRPKCAGSFEIGWVRKHGAATGCTVFPYGLAPVSLTQPVDHGSLRLTALDRLPNSGYWFLENHVEGSSVRPQMFSNRPNRGNECVIVVGGFDGFRATGQVFEIGTKVNDDLNGCSRDPQGGARIWHHDLQLVHLRLQNANKWQVAVSLRVIQSVSNHKHVGDDEAHVISLHPFHTALRFVQ
jgi:hypothetical protein